MNFLKRVLFNVTLFFADDYKKADIYSKVLGVKFGKNVRITGRPIFGSEPYLIEIGDDTTITNGVVFHTHDGSVRIFRKEYPNINIFGKIRVGNNVFIGSNSIILPNVIIGDNVVIGSGSVVSRSIMSNTVAVGVPAKVIKTIDEYKKEIMIKCVQIKEKDPDRRKSEILRLIDE